MKIVYMFPFALLYNSLHPISKPSSLRLFSSQSLPLPLSFPCSFHPRFSHHNMPTLETHNGYPLWEYIPNRPAAIVFAILFGCITIFHSYLMFRNRQWFCLPFVIGGLCKSQQAYLPNPC